MEIALFEPAYPPLRSATRGKSEPKMKDGGPEQRQLEPIDQLVASRRSPACRRLRLVRPFATRDY